MVFLVLTGLMGQTKITGVVVDGETGVPIEGANITVEGEGLGDAADFTGAYVIQLDGAGTHKILVSAIGYEESAATVTRDQTGTVELNFSLTPSVIELNPVMVLKERSSLVGSWQNFLRIPGSASVVTTRDLEKYADTDINRIIARIPGVYTQEEDGYGLRPNIGMRGTGVERSSKINLMEDGIPIAPAPYASPAAYYSPTAGRMEAFEVRKGSSQIKYGPHTTGGALNYVSTSIPDEFRIRANLSVGRFGAARAHVNMGTSGENYGFLLETYLDKTDGFKQLDHAGENTGYNKKDYLAKFRLNTSPGFAIPAAVEVKHRVTDEISNETYLGLTRADYSADPLRRYAASGIDQMDADHKQTVVTGVVKPLKNLDLTAAYYKNEFDRNWYKLSKVGGTKIGSLLAAGNSHENYALVSADNTEDDVFQLKANNRMYEASGLQMVANARFRLSASSHSLMAGFRRHADEMDRYQKVDKYGMRERKLFMTTEGVWGTGKKNNRFYYAEATSFFVEDEIEIGDFTVTAGVRLEDIMVERKEWKDDDPNRELDPSVKRKNLSVVVPGIGFVYHLRPTLSFLGGVHKGFSPPGPGVNEEDDVRPEESVNLEVGAHYRSGLTDIQFIYFNNHYDNLLGDDTQFAGEGTYDQFNAGEVGVSGLEVAASHVRKAGTFMIPLHLSYTFTQTEFLTSFESGFDPWGTVEAGFELPYVPRHSLFGEVGVEESRWRAYLRLKHVSALRTSAGKDYLSQANSTDPLTLVDLAGEYRLSDATSLFVNVYNLTDTHAIVAARPAGVRPTMPRNISAGTKVTF